MSVILQLALHRRCLRPADDGPGGGLSRNERAGEAARRAHTLATLFTATLLTALAPGREDYRGASRYILEHARPGDVVLINPAWSRVPERSPNGWDFYAQRLPTPDGAPPPPRVLTDDWERVQGHPRVWALVRNHFPVRVLEKVRARSSEEQVVTISPGIQVYLFTMKR